MDEQLLVFLVLFGLAVFAVVLLLFGRRLFWLLGGAALAIAGAVFATFLFEPSRLIMTTTARGFDIDLDPQRSLPIVLVVAAICALIGIFLTLRYRAISAGIVGFVSGVSISFILLELFGPDLEEWIRRSLYIIGGTAVALVAMRQPEQTMIVLSCIFGAELLIGSLRLDVNAPSSVFVWLIAMLVGIIFQVNSLRLERLNSGSRSRAVVLTP